MLKSIRYYIIQYIIDYGYIHSKTSHRAENILHANPLWFFINRAYYRAYYLLWLLSQSVPQAFQVSKERF